MSLYRNVHDFKEKSRSIAIILQSNSTRELASYKKYCYENDSKGFIPYIKADEGTWKDLVGPII